MSDNAKTKAVEEPEPVKLCLDLTGTLPPGGRGGVMSGSLSRPALLSLALACLLASVPPLHASPSSSATNAFIPQPLSLADAVNLALPRFPLLVLP